METVEFLLRRGLIRAACTRSKVAAVAVMEVQGVWAPVALGWNHASWERASGFGVNPSVALSCRDHCPRARLSDGELEPGKSSYDWGASRCIALHAEEMAIRGVKAYDRFDGHWSKVRIITTREPCYKCDQMLTGLGVNWEVWDVDAVRSSIANHPASSPSVAGRA